MLQKAKKSLKKVSRSEETVAVLLHMKMILKG